MKRFKVNFFFLFQEPFFWLVHRGVKVTLFCFCPFCLPGHCCKLDSNNGVWHDTLGNCWKKERNLLGQQQQQQKRLKSSLEENFYQMASGRIEKKESGWYVNFFKSFTLNIILSYWNSLARIHRYEVNANESETFLLFWYSVWTNCTFVPVT